MKVCPLGAFTDAMNDCRHGSDVSLATERRDFSVKRPTSKAQGQVGSAPSSVRRRTNYLEALSPEELIDVEIRRKRFFAHTSGPQAVVMRYDTSSNDSMTPKDSPLADDQQRENPRESQGDDDPIMEGIRSVLQKMELQEV